MVSPVWELFTHKDVSTKRACCSKCFTWISYQANTSNLIYHMTSVHKISYESMKKQQQQRAQKMISLGTNGSQHMKGIRYQQTKAYVSAGLPFSVSENPEFRKFISMLNPDFKQNSADTIKTDILKMEFEYRNRICAEFKNSKNLTILSDGWSSANAEFVLYCIVVAGVDNDNNMYQKLVGVCDTKESNADDLLRSFAIELGKSGLSLSQFTHFVGDGGTNLKSFADRLKIPRLHCLCHQIHLMVTDAFELAQPSRLLAKARKIATALSKSNKLKSAIKKTALSNGNKLALPKNYSITRWNGIRSLLKSIRAHLGTLATQASLAKHSFSGKEQNLLNFLVDVLEPVENCSIRFESKSSPASEAIPYMKLLKVQIKGKSDHYQANQDYSNIKDQIVSFSNRLLNNLQTRSDLIRNNTAEQCIESESEDTEMEDDSMLNLEDGFETDPMEAVLDD
ncbi:unnamed protein product [Caenorhabditis brenneri]